MVKLLSLLLDLSPLAQENRVIALHTANLFHGKSRSPHSKAMPNAPQHKAANCWCSAPSGGVKPAGDDAGLPGQGALSFEAQWIPKSKNSFFSPFPAYFYLPNQPPSQ
jgi:hypothetical protein